MRDLYVWSGSLTGVHARADTAQEAVEKAVRDNIPCVLGPSIRVTRSQLGSHALDVVFRAPYEEKFPLLFDGTLDVTTKIVTKEK